MTARLFLNTAASRFHTDRKTGEEPRVVCLSWWRDDRQDPVCRLIRPATGMTMDPGTFPYHKLTIEQLEQDGVDPQGVIREWEDAARGVRSIIAFNADFHFRNLHRFMGHTGALMGIPTVCAMKLAEPIVAIWAIRPGGVFKAPNMRECCERFGIPVPASGDPIEFALSTVQAVRAIYEACVQEINTP